jgi:dimethylhistidine N-methyltransferase
MYNGGMLVELGSGNSRKTRIIINALLAKRRSLKYFPIDISYEMLNESSETLLDEYQDLSISAVIAEYDEGLSVIQKNTSRKLVLFLGSSLGNFEPAEAKEFMQMIRSHIQDQDTLLIGFDMHKDSSVLNAAYNDSQGITARFNLNILARINRELDGDFNLRKFEHRAFYSEAKGRVEMHLVSKEEHEVNIKGIGETITFKEDESIHTENSYKFTFEQIESMIEGDFQIVKNWTDKKGWYSVILLAPVR